MAEMKVFSGTKSRYVAEKIAKELGVKLGKINIQHFADGEFEVSYEEPVRGAEVYLVQSTFSPTENLMELLLMIDAAKRASAQTVIAVIPYFGWARQDRKDKPRVSIAAKLVSNILIAAGIDRLITMDLHADQIQGFFDVPVDHLYASTMFVPDIAGLKLGDNLVIASPDVGGAKRANSYAKYFNAPLVLCHKQRLRANEVENMTVIAPATVGTLNLYEPTGTLSELKKPVDYLDNVTVNGLKALRPNGKPGKVNVRLSSREFVTTRKMGFTINP